MRATDRDITFYLRAKDELTKGAFAPEINWQIRLTFKDFTESDLLREAAWVIMCSGFKESIVRRYFNFVSLCFCDWQSAALICECAERCRATAIGRFKNTKKIDAIIETARLLTQMGFAQLKQEILKHPIQSLQALPFIGPITAFHLAKNLGFATAKPDRHLERLARSTGYANAHELCGAVAAATGDPIQVIDIVLWRYAEQRSAGGCLSIPQLGRADDNGVHPDDLPHTRAVCALGLADNSCLNTYCSIPPLA